jgi:hypothetical protein
MLLGIPSDTASLERNYVLADEDLQLIVTRRYLSALRAAVIFSLTRASPAGRC